MKKAVSLIVIVSWLSCNSNQQYKQQESDNLYSSRNVAENSLNGTWGLTNYFDSIIKYKKISKYRIQEPTWFALLLQIKNDTLTPYGSMEYLGNTALNLKSDTLTHLYTATGICYLIKKDSILVLKLSETDKDSTLYVYRKRDDLDFLTHNMEGPFKISNNVTTYFNQNLLAGEYQIIGTNKKVQFKQNGKLIGLDGFDEYEIDNYFGTCHPMQNLDVVAFINPETMYHKFYNWIFKNDQLILTEFVPETIVFKGEKVETDNFILGSEIIKLKVLK